MILSRSNLAKGSFVVDTHRALKQISLSDAIELWLFDCRARHCTPATIANYRSLGRVLERHIDVELLADVTHTALRKLVIAMDDAGHASAYVHGTMKNMRAFLNFCVADGLLDKSPMIKMPKLAKKVKPALSDADLKKVLDACPSVRDKAIVSLILESGVRASELCAMLVEDVDLDKGTALIRKGKGQKQRFVYFGADTKRYLKRCLLVRRNVKPTDPLFCSLQARNTPFTSNGIVQLFLRLQVASGVHVTAHGLRRTFATRAMRSGMNIYVTAKLMGHTDIDVLKQYLDVQDEDAAESYQRIFG